MDDLLQPFHEASGRDSISGIWLRLVVLTRELWRKSPGQSYRFRCELTSWQQKMSKLRTTLLSDCGMDEVGEDENRRGMLR